jgi:hypothetical protein
MTKMAALNYHYIELLKTKLILHFLLVGFVL